MNKLNQHFLTVALAATITAAAFTDAASASTGVSSVKLLTAQFEPRQVVQVEVGDFHFTPGQVAPIHTHAAPAVGYVVKGEIIYQVEGEKQQILSAGDVFYEPVGPRILRFDNASATEEAHIHTVFEVDFADSVCNFRGQCDRFVRECRSDGFNLVYHLSRPHRCNGDEHSGIATPV